MLRHVRLVSTMSVEFRIWLTTAITDTFYVQLYLYFVRCLTTDCQASPQASVKQHKASVKRYKAPVKHVPSICQASTKYLLDRCFMVAWYLLDRCLVVAWQMLHRCLLDRCLEHAWQMLYVAWQMLCAAWQMLGGILDNQLSSIWHSAQSICQALDGNGGVEEIGQYWKKMTLFDTFEKTISFWPCDMPLN